MNGLFAGDRVAACQALLGARRFEQALELAGEGLAADPGDAWLHCLAAQALIGLGRHSQAVEAAGRAAARAPNLAFPHRLAAAAYLALAKQSRRHGGFLVPAERAASEAVRLGPAGAYNHSVLAEVLAARRRYKEADAAVRKALQLAPASADMWISASYVAVKARKWRAAEIACRRALALDPTSVPAKNNLGLALGGGGRWTVGAVAFNEAAMADPRSASARDNVELVGFYYLGLATSFLLLPLLVVWPLFVVSSLGAKRWFARRPQRLKPLARRLGLRVARSPRYRRAFERRNTRAQLLTEASVAGWSAFGRYRSLTRFPMPSSRATLGASLIMVVAVLLTMVAAVVAAGAAYQLSPYLSIVAGVLVGAAAGVAVRRLWLRLRRGQLRLTTARQR